MTGENWVARFGISPTELETANSESANGEGPLFWCLRSGRIPESEYLRWASDAHGLPVLKTEYFTTAHDFAAWEKVKNAYRWRADLFPLAEWDGILFIACVEPPREFTFSTAHRFVLANASALQRLWSQLGSHLQSIPASRSSERNSNISDLALTSQAHHTLQQDLPEGFELGDMFKQLGAALAPSTENAMKDPKGDASHEDPLTSQIPDGFSLGALGTDRQLISAPLGAEGFESELKSNLKNQSSLPSNTASNAESISLPDGFSIETASLEHLIDRPNAARDTTQHEKQQDSVDSNTALLAKDQRRSQTEVLRQPPAPAQPQSNAKVQPAVQERAQRPPQSHAFHSLTDDSPDFGEPTAVNAPLQTTASPSNNFSSRNSHHESNTARPKAELSEALASEPQHFNSTEAVNASPEINSIHQSTQKVYLQEETPDFGEATQTGVPPKASRQFKQPKGINRLGDSTGGDGSSNLNWTNPDEDSIDTNHGYPESNTRLLHLSAIEASEPTAVYRTDTPTPFEFCTTFSQVASTALIESLKTFQHSMILMFKSGELIPWRWTDLLVSVKGRQPDPIDLSTPSIFRIVIRTSLPYHGYVTPSEVNSAFFADFHQGQLPKHATLTPIIIDKKVTGILMGMNDSDEVPKQTLEKMEALSAEVAIAIRRLRLTQAA